MYFDLKNIAHYQYDVNIVSLLIIEITKLYIYYLSL